MTPKIEAELNTCFLDAATEFFASTSLNVTKVADVPKEKSFNSVGTIGYTGKTMRGSLMVYCDEADLKSSYPKPSSDFVFTDKALSDWMGEIANQVLGRIKNSLTQRNVKFFVTVPGSLRGQEFSPTISPMGHSFVTSFKTQTSFIKVIFVVEAEPDFELAPKNERLTPVSEGEIAILNPRR